MGQAATMPIGMSLATAGLPRSRRAPRESIAESAICPYCDQDIWIRKSHGYTCWGCGYTRGLIEAKPEKETKFIFGIPVSKLRIRKSDARHEWEVFYQGEYLGSVSESDASLYGLRLGSLGELKQMNQLNRSQLYQNMLAAQQNAQQNMSQFCQGQQAQSMSVYSGLLGNALGNLLRR